MRVYEWTSHFALMAHSSEIVDANSSKVSSALYDGKRRQLSMSISREPRTRSYTIGYTSGCTSLESPPSD